MLGRQHTVFQRALRGFHRTALLGKKETSQYAARHLAAGVGRLSDLVFTKGEGCWLTTDDNEKYLDFASGIGVVNTGHCHPKVVKAVQDQAANLNHAQVNISFHQPMVDLVQRLEKIVPGNLDTFFFWNSGAEAVEAAVKLSRHATKRSNIVVMQGSYHGRTIGTMAMTTSKTIFRVGFGPLMPNVFVSPFPYRKQLGSVFANATDKDCNTYCLEQFENLLMQQSAPEDTAAIVIEPVLGEGGYVPAPPEFLHGVREICDRHGILMVMDEVQTGFGRTGTMFATEHSGVQPDILIMAKGLASGYPLSCIASRKELMDKQPAGTMGGTYAGNAVSCAAANATLDVFEEENLLENVRARSEQLFAGLDLLKAKYPIKEIRGHGLMIGIEFNDDVAKGTASAISKACLDEKMLLLATSGYECVRFIPALVVREAEATLALHKFEIALDRVFNNL